MTMTPRCCPIWTATSASRMGRTSGRDPEHRKRAERADQYRPAAGPDIVSPSIARPATNNRTGQKKRRGIAKAWSIIAGNEPRLNSMASAMAISVGLISAAMFLSRHVLLNRPCDPGMFACATWLQCSQADRHHIKRTRTTVKTASGSFDAAVGQRFYELT
jgi:hypothetical protein